MTPTTDNIIPFSTHRNMRKRIYVNPDVAAHVADTVPHIVGEGRADFVGRIVRAYLEGVR